MSQLPDQIRHKALSLIESGKYHDALAAFTELVAISDHNWDLLWRATMLLAVGRYTDALADYEIILKREPDDRSALYHIAFIRSACPDRALRDGRVALQLAQRTLELSTENNWRVLSLMAAAHAECGEFEQAEQFASRTLDYVPDDLHSRFERRLQQYRDGQPYRASMEANMQAIDIRDKKCIVCGEPAFLSCPGSAGGRELRCVKCASYYFDNPAPSELGG